MPQRSVWAEVDLQRLRENYIKLRTYTQSEIMPVVKADAYGHGVIPAVRTLLACGARRFGVALPEEALVIKAVFPEADLLILGVSEPNQAEMLVKEEIVPAVFRWDQALAVSRAAAETGRKARIHLKFDTGMNRIGFREEDFDTILKIAALPDIVLEGFFTHFATADARDLSFAREQLDRFNAFWHRLSQAGVHIPLRHAANSAAILQLPEAHFELVRPGICLYGFAPSADVGANTGLKPVMAWKAKVAHVKEIYAGETVSYGRTFQATGPTWVATIPVGYADGLRRDLSNQAEMLIRGRRVGVIGRVCMDQTMLDVTGVPGVQVGDVVTILGEDGRERITAMEMAEWLGTISYEVVCGISKRVPRVYPD